MEYIICSKTTAYVKIDKQIAEVSLHSSYKQNSVYSLLSIKPINWEFTVPLNESIELQNDVCLKHAVSVSDEIVIEKIKTMFTKEMFSLIYNQKYVSFVCTRFEFILFLQEKIQTNEDFFPKEELVFENDCMKIVTL